MIFFGFFCCAVGGERKCGVDIRNVLVHFYCFCCYYCYYSFFFIYIFVLEHVIRRYLKKKKRESLIVTEFKPLIVIDVDVRSSIRHLLIAVSLSV